MRVSCSTSCLGGRPLADALREIHGAGYVAVDVSCAQIEEAFGPGEDASRGLTELQTRYALAISSVAGAPLAAESAKDMAAGVQCVCRHLRLARRVGLMSISLAAGDRKRQDLDLLIAGLREAASYAGRLGMQIHLANRRGTRIEQLEDLRYVLGTMPRETVQLAIDCGEFHCAAVNPCHAFREFPGRAGLIRLSDHIGRRPVQAGQGGTNIPAVVEMAARSGYDGWLVVSGEVPPDEDPAAFLRASRKFLEQLVAGLSSAR